MVVLTLTLFSHSNSVHMLRNWKQEPLDQLYRTGLAFLETYLSLIAVCRLDVIHDINVDIVKDDVDTAVRSSLLLVHDVTKDNASLRRRHL